MGALLDKNAKSNIDEHLAFAVSFYTSLTPTMTIKTLKAYKFCEDDVCFTDSSHQSRHFCQQYKYEEKLRIVQSYKKSRDTDDRQ